MINDLDKINELTRNVRMSAEEKSEMRGNILRAVRDKAPARPILEGGYSIFSRFNINLKPAAAGVYAAILLSIGLGSAASYAAQGALPGDALYAVKIGVNERIQEVLAFSIESKAEVEADISEARLFEAAKLVEENRFTDENRTSIEDNFLRHAGKVQVRIEELKKKGRSRVAADLSARFETSLEAHAQILEKLDGEEMDKFLPKLKAKKKAAASLRMEIEAATTTLEKRDENDKKEDDEDDKEDEKGEKMQIESEGKGSVDNGLLENIKSNLGL